MKYWMMKIEWDHTENSSHAEVYRDGEHVCNLYACSLPDLSGDNPGFWSLDVPQFDFEADDVVLRPHGMGRAADLADAIAAAEAAAKRLVGGLELVA